MQNELKKLIEEKKLLNGEQIFSSFKKKNTLSFDLLFAMIDGELQRAYSLGINRGLKMALEAVDKMKKE